MKSFAHYLFESEGTTPEDISHMKLKPETQYGSNPGGIHVDPTNGSKKYVKFYRNPEQAKTEVAASKIYSALGVHNLQPKLVSHSGKLGLATNWRTDLKRHSPKELNNAPSSMHSQLADHFHAAVLTKNWDAIGLEHDNVMSDPHGNLHTVDLGGSFKFRAMGGPKDFGHDIEDHKSLMSPGRPSGDVFSKIPHDVLKSSAQKLTNLTDDHIHAAVSGLKDAHEIASSIKYRRDALLNHYNLK